MQYEKIDQKKSDLNIAISPMRLISIFSIILNIWAVIDQIKSVDSLRSLFVFSRIMLINFWLYVFMLGIGLFCFIITFLSWGEKIENLLNAIHKATSSIGWLNWLLFFIPIVGYGYYRLSGFTFRIIDYINPLWFIGHLALFAAIFLWSTQKVSFSLSILLSLMLYGCFLWIISFFPEINDYPLSLGWSEANRYYYASLYFSPLIYGKWVPLPSLHPTRYLMQSIPFLFHSNHILFHRLWQSFLWVITTFTAGYALSRRLKFDNKWISIGLASWFFLFVFQGPVYYHLMIVVIMILFGFDKDRLWRSLVIVILASIWAGISRVNWFPVAGMLAVALYVLETPQGENDFWAYWGWPIIAVVVGLLFAFGSQSIYARISGNPVEVFSSSFSSPLYRYRLFPNDAFGSGIILMIIYACSPISILLVWKLIASLKAWKILRVMALASILLALLVAGLIVSM